MRSNVRKRKPEKTGLSFRNEGISLTNRLYEFINNWRAILISMNKTVGGTVTMNKTELIAAVAEKAELSKKDAEKAVKALTEAVAEELKKGGKVQLVGFGTFEVSERAAREGRNPQTGAAMKIAASKMPKFKAGKALKDMINA